MSGSTQCSFRVLSNFSPCCWWVGFGDIFWGHTYILFLIKKLLLLTWPLLIILAWTQCYCWGCKMITSSAHIWQPPSGAFSVEPDWVTSDPATLRLQTCLCQAQVFRFSHQAKVQGLKALNNSVFWRLLKGQVYETEKKSRHTHWISYLGASLYRSYQSSTPQGSFSIFFFFLT